MVNEDKPTGTKRIRTMPILPEQNIHLETLLRLQILLKKKRPSKRRN